MLGPSPLNGYGVGGKNIYYSSQSSRKNNFSSVRRKMLCKMNFLQVEKKLKCHTNTLPPAQRHIYLGSSLENDHPFYRVAIAKFN